MVMWYDDDGCRRGELSYEGYAQSITDVVSIILFLASDGPSTATAVASGVSGMTAHRAKLLLDLIVEAGGATVNSGTYTGVLVEDA